MRVVPRLASMDSLLSLYGLPPSAPLTATYNCNTSPLDLLESFLGSNSLASIDLPDISASSSAPNSRKRKSSCDVGAAAYPELVVSQSGWRLSGESSYAQSSFPQWNKGQNITSMKAQSTHHHDSYDDHAGTNNCNDLEDVLNFLWMEDDTASTAQSDASFNHASNGDDQFPSLIRELDWEYCSNESSSNYVAESSTNYEEAYQLNEAAEQQGEAIIGASTSSLCKKPAMSSSCINGRGSWQKVEEEEGAGDQQWWQPPAREASWQLDGNRARASWQDGGRASWQEGRIRASWQAEGGGAARASWQAVTSAGGADQQRPSSLVWAGPTLLDIESALATTTDHSCTTTTPTTTAAAAAAAGPPSSSSTLPFFLDVKTLLSHGNPPPPLQDINQSMNSWRLKLQKRSSLEPKYTIKVESEEKALGDGYRWRKYGQKTIKNSPFPRSYYRCSSGKCNAKKQVEKCQEEGVFLVTYEGIHLHHKPNMLQKLRVLGDALDDEKAETFTSCEKEKSPSSPSSSTSCSHSIPPYN